MLQDNYTEKFLTLLQQTMLDMREDIKDNRKAIQINAAAIAYIRGQSAVIAFVISIVYSLIHYLLTK